VRKAQRWQVSLVYRGYTRRLDNGLGAESEAELAFAFKFALGVGRRRVVPLVGNSPGVEQHELDAGKECAGQRRTRKRDPDSERQLSSRISGTAQVPREMNTSRN
jgi:hypothetical protein